MKKSSVHCSNLFPDDLTQQALIYDKCLYQEVALIMLIYDVCLYQEVALIMLIYDVCLYQEVALIMVIYDVCLYQEVALIMLIYDVCLYQEVALVQHSERTATVESVTAMQLLVVSREDFMDIFFSRANGEEPDHITFSR